MPANTTATVHLPFPVDTVVLEGGRPAGEAECAVPLDRVDRCALYEVGVGRYVFSVEKER